MAGIQRAADLVEDDRDPLHRAGWRVMQALHLIGAMPDGEADARIRALLADDRQWRLLARLTPFDRAHHLRVHELLVARGETDPDLLRAALLHDVGKADERGRAHLGHRALKVLLRPVGQDLLDRLARIDVGPLHGLALARHHALLGARLAAAAGASARCCELIARHEERPPTGDPDLDALIVADGAAIR